MSTTEDDTKIISHKNASEFDHNDIKEFYAPYAAAAFFFAIYISSLLLVNTSKNELRDSVEYILSAGVIVSTIAFATITWSLFLSNFGHYKNNTKALLESRYHKIITACFCIESIILIILPIALVVEILRSPGAVA
ncbi:hypothetical protein [Emcibacter nanhaiensis]|uniref:Uncharacterized protein n=1 Tax=Emcibacter nanhaiensis TaxID=1505037 RepID=A0A501PTH9_9PROT|nr:hypothetical protein [Emcibacter nanhaiensis]TPD63011.1 hypothetical protein FIV46_02725 [Emcibacter nanhaiensis]